MNKADISSPSDRARLREIITDVCYFKHLYLSTKMKLPNCVGVFDVVATPQSCKIEVDECPKCHSDDIIIKRRQAMMLCEVWIMFEIDNDHFRVVDMNSQSNLQMD